MTTDPAGWNGVYAGIGVGHVAADTQQTWLEDDLWSNGPGPWLLHNELGSAGLTAYAGFNYVLGDNFVVGAEVEYIGMSAQKLDHGPWYPDLDEHTITLSNLWTATGRVGYAADTLLLYATAGLAGGSVKISSQCPNGCSSADIDSAGGQQIGWTVGAGVDWMLSDVVTLGLNYKYVDLGETVYDPDIGNNVVSAERAVDISANVLSARLGFSF